MAQHDYTIANQTFPATRTDLNNVFAAIVSQNSGATAPSTTYAYMLWYDTTTDILKMRNANDDAWVDLFTIDQVADTATPSAGGAGAAQGSNLIINGAMQVAQRGTSAVAATNSAYFGPDRFKYFLSGGGNYTVAQDTGHLAATGHNKAIKIAVTTAATSIAAGDYYSLLQRIEAKNVQHLQWGTASAKSLTLSFWVRATKTGTQALHFAKQGSGTDYRYVAEYTISASDTWEYKTITVTGLTADTIVDDSSTSLQVGWMLKYGSDFQGTKDVWTTSGIYTTSTAVNNMDSTSNTFYITGVQLELGEQATPFEHRSYGDELARCQRYFEKEVPTWGTPRYSDGIIHSSGYFKVQKRASPTMTLINDVYNNSPAIQQSNSNYYVTYDVTAGSVSLNCTYDADAEL